MIESHSTVRWGFFQMIYDADEPVVISDSRLRRAGYSKISVTSINARRQEASGRRRVGYDEWRADFDRLQAAHKAHAAERRQRPAA